MKLLKQNDNSGGLIFKQNSAGKALKQNYNFGFGFWKGASISAYVDCPSGVIASLLQPFTIAGHLDNAVTSVMGSQPLFSITNTLDSSLSLYLSMYNSDGRLFWLGTDLYPYNNGPGTNRNFLSLFSSGSVLKIWCNKVISAGINLSSLTLPTSFSIKCGILQGSNAAHKNGYILQKMDAFYVFNREISEAERLHLYNNRLGNEPLSTYGLTVYYKMDYAEILQHDGVNAVCVRDYSGLNNHGKIQGLPAGSLDSQLIYANTNLFKS